MLAFYLPQIYVNELTPYRLQRLHERNAIEQGRMVP